MKLLLEMVGGQGVCGDMAPPIGYLIFCWKYRKIQEKSYDQSQHFQVFLLSLSAAGTNDNLLSHAAAVCIHCTHWSSGVLQI